MKIRGLERGISAQHSTFRNADLWDNSEIICIYAVSEEGSGTGELKIVETKKKGCWLLIAKRRKRIWRCSMLMMCDIVLSDTHYDSYCHIENQKDFSGCLLV